MVEELVGNCLVHGLCEMNPVPDHVLGGVFAGGGVDRAAQVVDVEVEGPSASPAACLEGLDKVVLAMVLEDVHVCFPEVGIDDGSRAVCFLQLGQVLLEELVVGLHHGIGAGAAAVLVTVGGSVQS